MVRKRVLIVLSDKRTGMARLPKMLHRAGLSVDVLGVSGRMLELSRFVKRSTPCRGDQLLRALRSQVANTNRKYDWVMLADEMVLHSVAKEAKEHAWARAILPVPAHGNFADVITSKAAFTIACQANALPLPPSAVCHTEAELRDACVRLGYPAMIKNDLGFAGLGVRKVDGEEDLAATIAGLGPAPWVAQAFVNGTVGSTQLLMDRGRVLCWFASTKHVVFPDPFGPSCVRRLRDVGAMQDLVDRLGAMTMFTGLCGADWILDAQDRLSLLELNARPTSNYHLGPHADVNFETALRDQFAGGPVRKQVPHLPVDGRDTLIYMWPQHATRCIYMGEMRKLFRLIPGLGRNDLLGIEPRIFVEQATDLARRWFKHNVMRTRRQIQKLGSKEESYINRIGSGKSLTQDDGPVGALSPKASAADVRANTTVTRVSSVTGAI